MQQSSPRNSHLARGSTKMCFEISKLIINAFFKKKVLNYQDAKCKSCIDIEEMPNDMNAICCWKVDEQHLRRLLSST